MYILVKKCACYFCKCMCFCNVIFMKMNKLNWIELIELNWLILTPWYSGSSIIDFVFVFILSLHWPDLLQFVFQIYIPDHSMGTNIMRMLVEIKQLVTQSILLNQQRGIPGATAEVEEEEFSLPLTSQQELLNLEERLKVQSHRRKLVQSTDVLEAVRWRRSSLSLWPLSRSSSI